MKYFLALKTKSEAKNELFSWTMQSTITQDVNK